MDGAANWRPTQGADPAAVAAAGGVDPNAAAPAGGDWRPTQGADPAAVAAAGGVDPNAAAPAGGDWRPTQGADPAAVAAAGGVDPNAAAPAGGDWRTQLHPEARSRIVNKIMETLKRHLPVSVPEGLSELQMIAVRFEEEIYTAATNQSDYLRKISLKMLSMETQTKTQQNPGNAQVIPNQNPPGPAPGLPPQGIPNAAAPAGGDWRTQLQPEARSRIVNKIMETLKRHLPVSVPEGLSELQMIAVRFEEEIYTAATNQSDYLRKISLKMLSMETQTKTQQNPGNAQVIPNQNPPGPGSVH